VLGGNIGAWDGTATGDVYAVWPLWEDRSAHQHSLLYAEPWISFDEGGQCHGSLGLGFRHWWDATELSFPSYLAPLFSDGLYLGGSIFADTSHTAFGNTFWDLGSSVEIGTRYLTVRANYHWPLSDPASAGQSLALLSQSTSSSTQAKGPPRFLATPNPGFSTFGSPLFGTYDTRALERFQSKTTTRSVFQRLDFYEEALKSWDVEMEMLVPRLEKHLDVRLIAGLFGSQAGDYASDSNGWKAGVQIRPVPPLAFTAMWYDDDKSHDGIWSVGVGIEIPLGGKPGDLAKRHTRRLNERMLEPSRRDHRVAVGAGHTIQVVEITKTQNGTTRSKVTNVHASGVSPGSYISFPDGREGYVQNDGTIRIQNYDGYTFNGFGVIVVTPEPQRTVLLLMGLAFFVLRRRRK
jgi:hypothetical protein